MRVIFETSNIASRERLANEIVRAKWLSLLNGEIFDNRSSMSLTEATDLAKNDGKWPETTQKMVSDIENSGLKVANRDNWQQLDTHSKLTDTRTEYRTD